MQQEKKSDFLQCFCLLQATAFTVYYSLIYTGTRPENDNNTFIKLTQSKAFNNKTHSKRNHVMEYEPYDKSRARL